MEPAWTLSPGVVVGPLWDDGTAAYQADHLRTLALSPSYAKVLHEIASAAVPVELGKLVLFWEQFCVDGDPDTPEAVEALREVLLHLSSLGLICSVQRATQ
jgi:hypothetical protein